MTATSILQKAVLLSPHDVHKIDLNEAGFLSLHHDKLELAQLQRTSLKHPGCPIVVSMGGVEYGFSLCFKADQIQNLTTDELDNIVGDAFDKSFW